VDEVWIPSRQFPFTPDLANSIGSESFGITIHRHMVDYLLFIYFLKLADDPSVIRTIKHILFGIPMNITLFELHKGDKVCHKVGTVCDISYPKDA
jgi:hypothetical protein